MKTYSKEPAKVSQVIEGNDMGGLPIRSYEEEANKYLSKNIRQNWNLYNTLNKPKSNKIITLDEIRQGGEKAGFIPLIIMGCLIKDREPLSSDIKQFCEAINEMAKADVIEDFALAPMYAMQLKKLGEQEACNDWILFFNTYSEYTVEYLNEKYGINKDKGWFVKEGEFPTIELSILLTEK